MVAGLVIYWLSSQAYLTLLAVLALAATTWRFFLPIVFELSDRGVEQGLFGRQRRIPWSAVRRYEICSGGVLLLPHEDRSILAPFRGLYVPWTMHRDEILRLVQHYLAEPMDVGSTRGSDA